MTTATDTIAGHRERSRHFLALVGDELARDEPEEARNKPWGAGAHAIEAVAERRGRGIMPTHCRKQRLSG